MKEKSIFKSDIFFFVKWMHVKRFLQLDLDEIKETLHDQTGWSRLLIRDTPAFAQSDEGRTVANTYFV